MFEILRLSLYSLLTIFIFMNFAYVIALYLKKNDVADIAWGLGFVVVAFVLLLVGNKSSNYYLVFVLTLFWGIRLFLHIFTRNRGKSEDFRYKKWREEWGKWFLVRTYFQVFMLQGVLMFVISFSAIVSAARASQLNVISYIGTAVWVLGFFFETVGDWQLRSFISEPANKGKIMMQGLWKYTRHPNYFGEVIQWWGIFFVVFTAPFGLIALVSPLTITFLILKVSGIPMLEERYKGNVEFEAYKKRTNAFFPWFSRRN